MANQEGMTSWGKAIATGVLGQQNVFPKELSVTYSNGSTLSLTGTSLSEFWQELVVALVTLERMQATIAAQEERESVGKVATSEELRKAMNLVQKQKDGNKEGTNTED